VSEEEEKEEKSELEDSEEKGKAEEEKMDDFVAKDDLLASTGFMPNQNNTSTGFMPNQNNTSTGFMLIQNNHDHVAKIIKIMWPKMTQRGRLIRMKRKEENPPPTWHLTDTSLNFAS